MPECSLCITYTFKAGITCTNILHTSEAFKELLKSFLNSFSFICVQVLHSQGFRVKWGLVVCLQQTWVCKLFKDCSSLQGAERPLLYCPCSVTHAMPKTHMLMWVNTNFLLSARSKWVSCLCVYIYIYIHVSICICTCRYIYMHILSNSLLYIEIIAVAYESYFNLGMGNWIKII